MAHRRRLRSSCSAAYYKGVPSLVINGGDHTQVNHQTSNAWKETNQFHGNIYGYIHKVKNPQGPVTAFRQDKVVHDRHAYHPSQSAHRRPSPSQTSATGGRKREPRHLTPTGGNLHASPKSCHQLPPIDAQVKAELSLLSPEMQQFAAELQHKATRKRKSAPRKPDSNQPNSDDGSDDC